MKTRIWGLVVAFVGVVLNRVVNHGRDELCLLTEDSQETTNLIDSDIPATKQTWADLNRRFLEQMVGLAEPSLPLATTS